MFGFLAYGSFQALQSYRDRGGERCAASCIVSDASRDATDYGRADSFDTIAARHSVRRE